MTNETIKKTYERISGQAFKFNALGSAKCFVNRAMKAVRVMLGDDGLFWVVTPADAARLEKMGFEYAR